MKKTSLGYTDSCTLYSDILSVTRHNRPTPRIRLLHLRRISCQRSLSDMHALCACFTIIPHWLNMGSTLAVKFFKWEQVHHTKVQVQVPSTPSLRLSRPSRDVT